MSVAVTDGKFVAFQATVDPIGAAIIKGGDDANTYVRQPGLFSDSGLASPVNASGNSAALSNIGGFCWNPVRDPLDPIEKCYTDETAWAAGSRYVRKGNWATYTAYNNATKTVSLLAGQFYHAGDVTLAPEGSQVKITVVMKPGFRFALNPNGVNEAGETIFKNNVKIHPYASQPAASNPAPGLFSVQSLQTKPTAEILVPVAKYYGIHVDIEREIPCPVVTP